MVKAFDATASQWGWERIVPPDPARSEFLKERLEWVRENLERPVYEAALSVSAGWNRPEPCPYDDMADKARRRGMVVTMSLEEGLDRVEPARTRLNREPHFGKCYPKIGEQESAEFVAAFNILRPYMLEIAGDRCAHPPWQEQPTVRPEDVPSPNDAPTSDKIHPSEATTLPLLPREYDKTPGSIPLGTMSPPPPAVTTGCSLQTRNDGRKNMVKDQVFISYSHEDDQFFVDMLKGLKPLERAGRITTWSDKKIKPGSEWFDEIKAALAKTSVAVMLVSPAFLASDFIHDHEFWPLLKDAKAGGVTILWVLIRDCLWKETPLKDYQAVVSPPDKPFAEMRRPERDTAWRKVCEAINEAVNP
jgi:hypothetical protein